MKKKKKVTKQRGENYADYLSRQQKAIDIIAEEAAKDVMAKAKQRMLDYCTITLGRMGWKPNDFKKFSEILSQVDEEFEEKLLDDYHHDKDYWYSHAKLDESVSAYVGDLFVEYKIRYGEMLNG